MHTDNRTLFSLFPSFLSSCLHSRNFMQDTMNKMVSSVRHGVLGPDDASRTIHECAAMLGLELASQLPEDTIVIAGMRKNATRTDLIVAFREFGEIEVAAISSNLRGFGKCPAVDCWLLDSVSCPYLFVSQTLTNEIYIPTHHALVIINTIIHTCTPSNRPREVRLS